MSFSAIPNALHPPDECISEICTELLDIYGQDIAPTLQLWNEQSSSIAENEHIGWAATQTIGLGVEEEKRSREALERRLKEFAVRDLRDVDNAGETTDRPART